MRVAQRQSADGPQLLLKLAGNTRFDGKVAGIVWSRRDLVEQQSAVGAQEKLHAEHTDDIQRRQDRVGMVDGGLDKLGVARIEAGFPRVSEADTQAVRRILKAGCRVVMSTDCGIPNTPHEDLAVSMGILQRMTDLAPVEVLKLATSTSAVQLGLPDRGVVADGTRADLIVIEGDPTEDLGALRRVRAVVRGGELVHRVGL